MQTTSLRSGNAFFGFIFQTVVSTFPSVLAVASLPVSTQGMLTLSDLGLFFAAIRVGSVLGTQIGPWMASVVRPYIAAAAVELFNGLVALLIYATLVAGEKGALVALCLVKGFCAGSIPVIRTPWIKQAADGVAGKRVAVICSSLAQVAFGFSGFLLILGLSAETAKRLFLLDAASSLVGALLFWSLRTEGAAEKFMNVSLNVLKNFRLLNKASAKLLVVDALLAAGMGGTSFLLVRLGHDSLGAVGGYGLALLIYAFGYMVAGQFVQRTIALNSHPNNSRGWILVAGVTASVALSVLSFSTMSVINLIACLMLFLAYPVFLLNMEALWFTAASRENIAPLIAVRTLVLSLIWAGGEVGYGSISVPTLHFSSRAALVSVGVLTFVKLCRDGNFFPDNPKKTL